MGRRHYDLTALRAEWAMAGYTLQTGHTTRALGINKQKLGRAFQSRKQAEAGRVIDLTAETEEGATGVPESGARLSKEEFAALKVIPVEQFYRTTIKPVYMIHQTSSQRGDHPGVEAMERGHYLADEGPYNQPPRTSFDPNYFLSNQSIDWTTEPPNDNYTSAGISEDALQRQMLGDIHASSARLNADLALPSQLATSFANGFSDKPSTGGLDENGAQQQLPAEWSAIPEAGRIISPEAIQEMLNDQRERNTSNYNNMDPGNIGISGVPFNFDGANLEFPMF